MHRFKRQSVLIAVALVVLIALAVLVVGRSHSDGAAAAREAGRFNASAASTPQPTDTRPVVTVIGDNLSSAAQLGTQNTLWPVIVARDLDARIISLSSAGAGYTSRSASTSFGGTFLARAQQADSRSRAVIFFGGANDDEASTAALKKASSASIAAARQAAPMAQIIVVGPPWPDADPPQRLLRIRDALRSVTDRAGVTWVDPISEKWLTGEKVIESDNATLLAGGEEEIARRMESRLKPVLR